MKKISCLALVLSLGAYTASAQLYVSVGLGFAFPQSGQSVYDTPIPYYELQSAYNGTRSYNSNGSQTYDIKNNASFSAGFSAPLSVGYMFSENVGVQLGADFGLAGSKYTFTDENFPLNVGSGSTIPYNISTTQHASEPIFLMPALVLQTNGDKLNLYTRLGLALPMDTRITEDQVFTNAPNTGALTIDDFTWNITNSFSLGYTAAAGLKYKISDVVSVWGEVSFLSMSVYTKEQDLKSWNEDGQSVPLSNYAPNPTTIKFSKTATLDSTYSQFPPYALPFSNIGVNVGITFILSKERRRSSKNSDDMDETKPFRRR